MISLNKAMIVGNLTRDPELRYTPSGKSVCSFGIATNRRWKDAQGNPQEETEFHDIVAWGKLAEIICQILKKGAKAFVEGRLRTRSWEGQDGVKRQRTEVIMENFIPLTPKGLTQDTQQMAESASGTKSSTEEPEETPLGKSKPAKKTTEKEEKDEKSLDEARDKPLDKARGKDEEIDLDDIPF